MGIIFDIQRCSYHDGPGIRTTVFFKGCPLRCAWCHNPESFSFAPQLRYVAHLCTACKACLAVCPHGVHRFSDGLHTVDFTKCAACGQCMGVCPSGAVSLIGREASVEEIMGIVRQDAAYYRASGGGLTVSGGEPTAQPDFLIALLTAAKRESIHTCLETNGYIPKETLDALLPWVDLYLVDFKLTEQEGLHALTKAAGRYWAQTMDALTREDKPVILRLPLIPGINDTEAHLEKAAAICRQHPNIRQTEIMPYHSIGSAKWAEIGLAYSLPDLSTVTPELAAQWEALLRRCAPSA